MQSKSERTIWPGTIVPGDTTPLIQHPLSGTLPKALLERFQAVINSIKISALASSAKVDIAVSVGV